MLALRPLSTNSEAISKQENAHQEAVLLVAGDFNAGKLKSVLPNFYQHVKCATRGEKLSPYRNGLLRSVWKKLDWPAQSPDLNHIKLLCDELEANCEPGLIAQHQWPEQVSTYF
jgi:hypothetical protein